MSVVDLEKVTNSKKIIKARTLIFIFFLSTFLIFILPFFRNILFIYKYLSTTVISIIILVVIKSKLSHMTMLWYKYATIINLWLFIMYLIVLKKFMVSLITDSTFDQYYLTISAAILFSYLFANIIPRIKFLSDNIINIISMIIYCIAIILFLYLNTVTYVNVNEVPLSISIIKTIVLAVVSFISILAISDITFYLVMERKLNIEWQSFIISLYFVVILSQILVTQYRLEFTNVIFSIIFIFTALSWILVGFIKRNVVRLFGLVLLILSFSKLFLIDLAFLSSEFKIILYFVLYGVIITILFLYKYFNERIKIMSEG